LSLRGKGKGLEAGIWDQTNMGHPKAMRVREKSSGILAKRVLCDRLEGSWQNGEKKKWELGLKGGNKQKINSLHDTGGIEGGEVEKRETGREGGGKGKN